MMFQFLKKRAKGNGAAAKPVIYERKDHCVSRRDIDPDALKVLYRLSNLGYIAYLVGGGVRDLLMGRKPKDFDVGTSASPQQVKKAFHNCFLIGRRFRLAHVCFGRGKVIETATFRQASQSVGEIIEHAAEGPQEDNVFGTPATDAYRRDFTINGLFYHIADFSVIDYVGGMKDIKKKIIRSIGDPEIRFQEDPVRMMRAIKFSSRLGFKIEKATWAAIKKHHPMIKAAAEPRVCEEVYRLFPYGESEKAFRLLWESGLMGDLVPEFSKYVSESGGAKSPAWKYLAALDEYEKAMEKRKYEVSNGLRTAVLLTGLFRHLTGQPGTDTVKEARRLMRAMVDGVKVSKAVYFTGVILFDSLRRFEKPPKPGKTRFVHSKDFLDALDYNRIVARAEGRSEKILDRWAEIYEKGQ